MSYLLATFIVKMLSPSLAIISVIGGLLSKAWWQVGITALAGSLASEAILGLMQPRRGFNVEVFAIGCLSAFVIAAAALGLRKLLAKR